MLGIECCVLNCVDSESERILRIGLSWGWLGAGQMGAAKMNFSILTPTKVWTNLEDWPHHPDRPAEMTIWIDCCLFNGNPVGIEYMSN